MTPPRDETTGLDARFCVRCHELTEVDAVGLCAACPPMYRLVILEDVPTDDTTAN